MFKVSNFGRESGFLEHTKPRAILQSFLIKELISQRSMPL